jgi:RNA polymerase sigma factor (sigma-70 family)
MEVGDDFPEVLEAAKGGDPDAIERLYRSTVPAVLGYLRASGAFDAEDLTSEVYVSMMSSLSRFDGSEDRFRSWLLTIAHRRLVDAIRRSGRRPEVLAPVDTLGTTVVDLRDTETEALSRLRVTGVLDAVDELTEDQRSVLLLRVVSDLAVRDIAEVIGKPETAVKALLRRAIKSLERRIDSEASDDEPDT